MLKEIEEWWNSVFCVNHVLKNAKLRYPSLFEMHVGMRTLNCISKNLIIPSRVAGLCGDNDESTIEESP